MIAILIFSITVISLFLTDDSPETSIPYWLIFLIKPIKTERRLNKNSAIINITNVNLYIDTLSILLRTDPEKTIPATNVITIEEIVT